MVAGGAGSGAPDPVVLATADGVRYRFGEGEQDFRGTVPVLTAGRPVTSSHLSIRVPVLATAWGSGPVGSGAGRTTILRCTSCHDPHGTATEKMLIANSVNEQCYTCHTEKRGPFLWEHAPVVNACVTCHDPHGSSNERMLVAKVPFICQRCHVTSRHPPTIYDGFVMKNSSNGNKLTGRGCVICHSQIHGSNSPNGKAFLR